MGEIRCTPSRRWLVVDVLRYVKSSLCYVKSFPCLIHRPDGFTTRFPLYYDYLMSIVVDVMLLFMINIHRKNSP